MKVITLCAGLALCLFACSGGDSESLFLDVAVGLETPNGVESIESATEFAVYIGPAGGHVAFFWIGGDVPNECLGSNPISDCSADLTVTSASGVVLDFPFGFSWIESPLNGWRLRLSVGLDFSRLGFDVEPPFGQVVDIGFSLSVDGSSTEVITSSVTLVEGQFTPESR